MFNKRYKQKRLIHFDQVHTEKIHTINRILFYLDIILNPATEPSLEAYLSRTITSNYVDIFSMMVCTGKLGELVPLLSTNLQGVLEFLTEVINGVKVHLSGHEDIKWRVFNSFYDRKLLQALIEVGQLRHANEEQMILLLDIIGVVAISAEKLFLDFLRSTYSDDICITKLLIDCMQQPNDNIRLSVGNTLRHLLAEGNLKKEFA